MHSKTPQALKEFGKAPVSQMIQYIEQSIITKTTKHPQQPPSLYLQQTQTTHFQNRIETLIGINCQINIDDSITKAGNQRSWKGKIEVIDS